MDRHQEIHNHIEEYGVPSRMVCPYCGGGSSGERCMTIFFADNERTVLATCHRAHCPIDTIAVDGAELRTRVVKAKDVHKANWFDRAQQEWLKGTKLRNTGVDWKGLRSMHHSLVDKYLRVEPEYGVLMVRQLDENNNCRGVVRRIMNPAPGATKSFTFSEEGYHGMGFFSMDGTYPEHVDPLTIIAVEDSFSAMMVASQGWDAVSLNGTHLNEHRFTAIRSAHNNVIVCLDADATRDAIRTAQKFSGVGSIEVRRLMKDFKDMSLTEFIEWEARYLT